MEIIIKDSNLDDKTISIIQYKINRYVEKNIKIKKCKKCGRLFISNKKQYYCDYTPNYNNPNNKSCKNLSADMKGDEITRIYRNFYRKANNYKKRNPEVFSLFTQLQNELKEYRDSVKEINVDCNKFDRKCQEIYDRYKKKARSNKWK